MCEASSLLLVSAEPLTSNGLKNIVMASAIIAFHFCFVLNNILFSVSWVRNERGGEVLLYNGYCFSIHKCRSKINNMWRCTNSYCKATIGATKDRKIFRIIDNHNHPPRTYIIREGVYIKI